MRRVDWKIGFERLWKLNIELEKQTDPDDARRDNARNDARPALVLTTQENPFPTVSPRRLYERRVITARTLNKLKARKREKGSRSKERA